MKKILLLSSAALLLATVATAGTVTFNTNATNLTGGISGSGTQSLTYAAGTVLTYVPVSVTGGSYPSGYPFGDLVLSCSGGGTACGTDNLTGTVLNLIFTQSVPSGGTGVITSTTITGTITGTSTSANAQVVWSNPNVVVAGVSYKITNSPLNFVNAAAGGKTSIQGFIDTPEPSSIVLLSSGLGLIAASLARRRRRS